VSGMVVRPRRRISGAAQAPVQRKSLLSRERALTLGLQILCVALFIGAWQILVNAKVFNPLWTSTPRAVWDAIPEELSSSSVRGALGYTLIEVFAGFGISAVGGIISGVLFFEVPILYQAIRPFITLFNNMPRLIFAPLLVLYFGIGVASRVALVVSLTYIVILLNTLGGLQNSDPDHLRLAKALGAGRVVTFTKFRLPAAIPSIFVGLQLGLNFSLTGAIVGELLTGGNGIGALVSIYMSDYATAQVFADILIIAILATILAALMRALERWLLAWRRLALRGLH
jgi:NitT/TauT family transport system permease protein